MAGRDTPPVLEPAEHDLSPVAPLVAALVIDPGLTVRRRKERYQTRHLRVAKPKKIAHVTAPLPEP